jgi:hypothetical protein
MFRAYVAKVSRINHRHVVYLKLPPMMHALICPFVLSSSQPKDSPWFGIRPDLDTSKSRARAVLQEKTPDQITEPTLASTGNRTAKQPSKGGGLSKPMATATHALSIGERNRIARQHQTTPQSSCAHEKHHHESNPTTNKVLGLCRL